MPELSSEALDQLFRTARSYNGYSDRPVEEAQLHAIWDLMKMGPTSANSLPARVVWCTSDAAKERLAECASEKNADKIRQAPVTAIIGMDMDFPERMPELFPHDPTARHWFPEGPVRDSTAMRNSSLQGAYLVMAARALGLDAGPMSGFDNAKVDEAFFAGTRVKSNFITTLGYGDPASLFDRLPRPAFDRFNTVA